MVRRIGPALAFEGLWRTSGCQGIVHALLAERRFQFDVERAVFASMLHRIMVSGSDTCGSRVDVRSGHRRDGGAGTPAPVPGYGVAGGGRCRRPISITLPRRRAA